MMIRPQHLMLPASLREQIFKHARQIPASECCGLLIGSGEDLVLVRAVVEGANVSTQPRDRFEIDPQVQFSTMRRLRGTANRIVGHYHSHPVGPAAPSGYDLSMAHDPEAIWVIVSLAPAETLAAYVCPNQNQGFLSLPITNAE